MAEENAVEEAGQVPRSAWEPGMLPVLAALGLDFSLSLLLPHLFDESTLRQGGVLAGRALLIAFFLVLSLRSRGRADCGWSAPRWRPGLKNSAAVVALTAGLLGLGLLAVGLLPKLFHVDIPFPPAPVKPTFWIVLSTCVLYPVLEETLYRGLLFPPLQRSVGTWRAIVLSGVVFQALHLAYGIWLPHYLIGGALLAWSFHASRSLFFPVLLHAAWNLLIVMLHTPTVNSWF